jgi:hypothetical protein
MRAGLLVLLLSSTAAANPTGYAWLGAEAAGRVGLEDFDRFLAAAMKIPDLTVEMRPDKARILEQMKTADVLYANTHSGYPKSPPPRMVLQTGKGASEADQLSAVEIAQALDAAGHLPKLVVINGCNTLADPPGGGRLLKIHEALKIKDGIKGRAYVGFGKAVVGVRGDEYFRIFFAKWTHEPYPTLEEARRQAVDFFDSPPHGQKYLDKRAGEIGADVKIVGDRDLRFSDL